METIDKLQSQAKILHELLVKYALTDIHAAMVLDFMLPLLGEIDDGKVVTPTEFAYRWYFGSTDSPLARFDDLIDAAAKFSHTLEGWPDPIISSS